MSKLGCKTIPAEIPPRITFSEVIKSWELKLFPRKRNQQTMGLKTNTVSELRDLYLNAVAGLHKHMKNAVGLYLIMEVMYVSNWT